MIIQQCCFSVSNEKLKACWLLTNQCNRSCSYCAADTTYFTGFTPKSKRSEDAKRVAKLCIENSIYKIILSGGEPLLLPDIADTVQVLASKGLRVSLSTNGILLSTPMLSKLKSSGLTKVVIGLHWEDRSKNEHKTKSIDELEIIARNVYNAKIAHEYSVVLVPSIALVVDELYSIINVSFPEAINLIEPQKCGRFRKHQKFENQDSSNNMMILAERLTERFSPTETILVLPRCSEDCPSEKQVFGISNNLMLERCPWKSYFDYSSCEESNKTLPLRKLAKNDANQNTGDLLAYGPFFDH